MAELRTSLEAARSQRDIAILEREKDAERHREVANLQGALDEQQGKAAPADQFIHCCSLANQLC